MSLSLSAIFPCFGDMGLCLRDISRRIGDNFSIYYTIIASILKINCTYLSNMP